MNPIRTQSIGALVLLGVLLVGLVIITNSLFRGVRLDLTENQLYSISEGTESIVQSLEEPITLKLFFSDEASEGIPFIRQYANRVEEFLRGVVESSNGNIMLEVIDPAPFTEAEDAAAAYNLQAVPTTLGGDNIYLGLVGTNAIDGIETIPFLQPDKESFLEYDVAKLIHTLSMPDKPVVGILSKLPVTSQFDPQTRQMRKPWAIVQQLEQLFEVRTVQPGATVINAEIQLLLVIHPRELPEVTRYAIDQYVVGGGHAMIFVDPHAELDIPPQDPNNPQAAMFADRSSGLPESLKAWGVGYDKTQFIADYGHALQVSVVPEQPPTRHLGILGLSGDAINRENVTTAELDTVHLSGSGFFTLTDTEGVTTEVLLYSSEQAQPMAAQQLVFMRNPATLLNSFQPTGERYPLAVHVNGLLASGFDGAPEGSDLAHIARAEKGTHVVIVADTDILSDRMWVRTQNFFGQQLLSAIANNGDLITNLVDQMTGSSELITVRGRAVSARPFTKVQSLERQAESRFRDTEQRLQQELRETEQRLSDLQQQRVDQNLLVLSEEQSLELERFQDRKLEIRKELREVQRNLNEDIDRLGDWMKFINIALIPMLIIVGAGIFSWRRSKKKAEATP